MNNIITVNLTALAWNTVKVKYILDLIFNSWARFSDDNKNKANVEEVATKVVNFSKLFRYSNKSFVEHFFNKNIRKDIESSIDYSKYESKEVHDIYIPIKMFKFLYFRFYSVLLFKFYKIMEAFDPHGVNMRMRIVVTRKTISEIYSFVDEKLRTELFLEDLNSWLEFNFMPKVKFTKLSKNGNFTLYFSNIEMLMNK